MANRYWVGGAGSWTTTNTTNWSATSGGAGGASVPTNADDVFFDSGTGTVTISSGLGSAFCKSVSFEGFNGTLNLTNNANLFIYGGFKGYSGMSITTDGTTPIFRFNAPNGTSWNITTAGKQQPRWDFETAAVWTIGDDTTFRTNARMRVVGGTPSTCQIIGAAGSKRLLSFDGNPGTQPTNSFLETGSGSSNSGSVQNFNIQCRGCTNTSMYLFSAFGTNSIIGCDVEFTGSWGGSNQLTFASNTPNVTSLGTFKFTGSVSNPSGTYLLIGGGTSITCTSLILQPTSEFIFSSAPPPSSSCTITGANNSTSRVHWVERYPITPTASTFSLSNVGFAHVFPTTTWSGTSIENLGRCSNITFTPAVTRTATTNGTWMSSTTWGGSSMPLAQDTVVINSNVTVTPNRSLGYNQGAFFSNLTLNSNCTLSNGYCYWYGRDAKTIPSGVNTSTSWFYLLDTLANTTGSYSVNVSSDVRGLAVNVYPFPYDAGTIGSQVLDVNVSVDTSTRNLGDIFLSEAETRASINLPTNCSAWSVSAYTQRVGNQFYKSQIQGTNITFTTAGTVLYDTNDTVKITFTGTVNLAATTGLVGITHNGGLSNFVNLVITGTPTQVSFSGVSNLGLGNFSRTSNSPLRLSFANNRTYTCSSWGITGSAGNVVTIDSDVSPVTPGHTLSYTGTTPLQLGYLNVSYSNATPASTWYAGTTSTNGGNTTGWIFGNIPTGSGFFFGSNF